MGFDEYSKRLQEIITTLEKNNLSIEEGIKLYEEGVEISKKCYDILNKSKGKITFLKNELEEIKLNDDIDL